MLQIPKAFWKIHCPDEVFPGPLVSWDTTTLPASELLRNVVPCPYMVHNLRNSYFKNGGLSLGFTLMQNWIISLSLQFSRLMTLSKLFNCSDPQFLFVKKKKETQIIIPTSQRHCDNYNVESLVPFLLDDKTN